MNLEPVRASYDVIDRFTAALQKESAKRGRPMTCHEGCHYCCREPVWVERTEAEAMVATAPDPAGLRARTEAWWARFREIGGLAMPRPVERYMSALPAYRRANLWCPFLVERRCSSYAWRPAGCRLHIAVGPVSHCSDDAKRPGQLFMESPAHESAVVLRAHGELCQHAPRALFQYDHLGVWLKEMLLGDKTRSESAQDLMVSSTDP